MNVSSPLKTYALWINGEARSAEGGSVFPLINPATGEPWAFASDGGVEDAREAVAVARRTFDEGSWSQMAIEDRAACLARLAQKIRDKAALLAEQERWDTGKTAKQVTLIDVPSAAECFEFFASEAQPWLKDRPNPVDAPVDSRTVIEPQGVAACFLPWNYPFLIAAWKMAPALLAGNTVIVKPSPLACASVLQLAEWTSECGFPPGVIQVLSSRGLEAPAVLIENPDVDMISFTGGTETGRVIYPRAAASLKKVVLELGGKSTALVFADARREAALGGVMTGVFMNQGQMCTACSRVLVERSIAEEFCASLVERTRALVVGDPADPVTQIGPVISETHRQQFLAAVEQATKDGARLLCGGGVPSAPELKQGFYVEPAIMDQVSPEMPIFQKEVFGPVLTITLFDDEEEALTLVNRSDYGLAASVWTQDEVRWQRLARSLKVGTVWGNTYGGFFPGASYGGFRQSGLGRELGEEGLKEYTRSKHVCRDKTPGGVPLASSWF